MNTTSTTAPRRVLIVDSDPLLRELESDGLRAAGYSTMCSQGAEDTVRILADGHEFDLIIVDPMMPTMTDGLSLMRRIRSESRSTTPIMVHTAHADAADEARQAGATRVVVKPVAWKRFVKEIRELCVT